jgi:hypothetical protein
MGQVGYASGFVQQTSYGPGNVSVFIPWPTGGFAEYWYDQNRRSWNGPVVIGSGRISSLSWHEGDYQSHDNGDHFNFEMVTVEDGVLAYWWRENKAPFAWNRAPELLDPIGLSLSEHLHGQIGPAILGRTHNPTPSGIEHTFDAPFHQDLLAFAPYANGGVAQFTRTAAGMRWDGGGKATRFDGHTTLGAITSAPIEGVYSGVAWALGVVGNSQFNNKFGPPWDTNWLSDFDPSRIAWDGKWIIVGVGTDGAFLSFEPHMSMQQLGTGLRGRPAVIETDRGRANPAIGFPTYGNYEAFAPSRDGGIRHFWRANPPREDELPTFWNEAATVGNELYDEVSVIQLQDDWAPDEDQTPPLWLFGRIDGESWVDVFHQRHTDLGFLWEQVDGLGDPNRSDVWEVGCVKSRFIPSPGHERRLVLGIGGTHLGEQWKLDEAQAIDDIQARRRRFRTKAPDGSAAWVHVETSSVTGHPFLTTSIDVIFQNNLSAMPECPRDEPPPPTPLPFPVGGLIGTRWRELGGFDMVGLPTSAEYSVTGGPDRRQDFIFGQIVFAPAQGPRMLVWAHRVDDDIEFGWGTTSPFNYDFFIVRWSQSNGLPQAPSQQQDIRGGPRTFGRFRRRLPLGQIGSDGHHAGWSFIVEGADSGGLFGGTDAPQGWTIPLNLRL